MTATDTPMRNGVDTATLFATLDAVKSSPEIAKFQFRASNRWISGTHNRSTIHGFYGAGQELVHREARTYDADHPDVFAAEDNGSTPVEFVLVALGSCLTAGVASVAQQRSIQLRSVRATIEADFDLHGILGADPEVRNGFSGVRVNYDIDADATDDEIKAIVAQSQKRSAVYDVLTNPTSVTVEVN